MKNTELEKLFNLQLFAADPEDGSADPEDGAGDPGDAAGEDPAEDAEEGDGGADPDGSGAEEARGRTYTEAEVDAIVKKRLARERARAERIRSQEKRSQELDAREAALAARERRAEALDFLRNELKLETIPESSLDLLRYDSDEDFDKSVKAFSQFLKDYLDGLERKRSKGKTPKRINGRNNSSDVRRAFGLNDR